jgi:hypothetical protein
MKAGEEIMKKISVAKRGSAGHGVIISASSSGIVMAWQRREI